MCGASDKCLTPSGGGPGAAPPHYGVLSPLGRLAESELKDKLDDEVSLSWQELRASDLTGRARAFQSMVGGGMAVAEAVAVAGLMVED